MFYPHNFSFQIARFQCMCVLVVLRPDANIVMFSKDRVALSQFVLLLDYQDYSSTILIFILCISDITLETHKINMFLVLLSIANQLSNVCYILFACKRRHVIHPELKYTINKKNAFIHYEIVRDHLVCCLVFDVS